MLGSLNTYTYTYRLSIASFAIVLIGVVLSRAFISIGSIALFLLSIGTFLPLSKNDKRNFIRLDFLIPFTFFLLTVAGFFREHDAKDLNKDLEISLLWFVCSFGIGIFTTNLKPFDYSRIRTLFYVLVCIVGLLSVINYLLHLEEINRLLLQSKHIPIFGGMHHIYFGILNALLVLTKIAEWITNTRRIRSKWLLIEDVSALLIFVWLHILTSRTGLYAFYLAIPALILVALYFNRHNYKKMYWLLIPIVLMPMISYSFFPSFKNKIANTTEDLKATKEGGEEVNYKSMGMRIEAWKNSIVLIKQKPIIGHGSGNVALAMEKTYEESGSLLVNENRIGPHNQFFEYAIKFGIMGAFLLLFLLFWLIISAFGTKNLVAIGLIVFVSIILCLESVLERQQGAVMFALIYFLAMYFPKND